jgi:hypothetical protein
MDSRRTTSISTTDGTFPQLIVYEGTNMAAFPSWAWGTTNGARWLAGNFFDAPGPRYVQFSATADTSYQFQVVGGWRSSFALKLTATNVPLFFVQPQDCTVSPYGSAFFWAYANLPHKGGPWSSTPLVGFQWAFNGVPIPGETYPCLLIHGVTTNNAGTYTMIASNAAGITVSAPAILTVTDTNPVPKLLALPPGGSSQLPFTLTAEAGRWYKTESSTDLQNWVDPNFILPTNSSSLLSVSKLGPNHFVRASLDVPTEVCVAQLKQMRAALQIFAVENALSVTAPYSLGDLQPYIPLNAYGFLPWCPEDGIYAPGATVTNVPWCNIGHGHYIVDP